MSRGGLAPARLEPPAAAAAPAALRAETLCSERVLHELEPAWNALIEQAGPVPPFLSYEWVRTWWECFGSGRKLHVVVVKEGSRPIALLPLMRYEGRLYGGRVHRLETIGTSHAQRLDLLAARRDSEVYRTIWESLVRQGDLWDVLILSQIPADSPTVPVLSQFARRRGLLFGLWRSADAPYIALDGGWDSYFEQLPRALRTDLLRSAERLERLGPVRVETVTSEADAPGAVDEALRLDAARWRARTGTAILSDPAKRRFYTLLARRAARRGWLRLHFLTCGGRRIAFDYSLVCAQRAYSLRSAHDPGYASFSPSSQLLFRTLQTAAAQEVVEFDFLGRGDGWTVDWATRLRPHQWLYVMPSSARMRLLCFAKFRLVPRLQQYRPFLMARHAALAMAQNWPSRRSTRSRPIDGEVRDEDTVFACDEASAG